MSRFNLDRDLCNMGKDHLTGDLVSEKLVLTPGFYYHYKRPKDAKSVTENAYEVLGIGKESENKALVVVYRSLHHPPKVDAEGNLATFWVRPLEIFAGKVRHEGCAVLRFRKIEDKETIKELVRARDKMYPR